MAASRENREEDIYFLNTIIDDDLTTEEDCRKLFRWVIFQSVKDADKYSRRGIKDGKQDELDSVHWLIGGVTRPFILELASMPHEYIYKLEEIGRRSQRKETDFFDQIIADMTDKLGGGRKRFYMARS